MKRIKMCLYGDPGTGKSVWACGSDKPFFITTDGNYEWLEEFGAKPEDHIQVNNWDEAKKAFRMNFDKYETIVIDLLEDMFKWCERDYCTKNRFEHVSDVGYGKGYDITRNEFFLEMCRLIGMDKNIIFIMHGTTYTVKDRRGVEKTMYGPSNRIPDKVIDMIEGRVRYFLRCYTKAEEDKSGKLIKRRYLSLIPKENEFGICRGVDENVVPHDIPLDFAEFKKAIGLKQDVVKKVETVETEVKVEVNNIEPEQTVIEEVKPIIEETKVVEEKPVIEEKVEEQPIEKPVSQVVEEQPVEKPVDDKAAKLAAIKAKLAALKAGK